MTFVPPKPELPRFRHEVELSPLERRSSYRRAGTLGLVAAAISAVAVYVAVPQLPGSSSRSANEVIGEMVWPLAVAFVGANLLNRGRGWRWGLAAVGGLLALGASHTLGYLADLIAPTNGWDRILGAASIVAGLVAIAGGMIALSKPQVTEDSLPLQGSPSELIGLRRRKVATSMAIAGAVIQVAAKTSFYPLAHWGLGFVDWVSLLTPPLVVIVFALAMMSVGSMRRVIGAGGVLACGSVGVVVGVVAWGRFSALEIWWWEALVLCLVTAAVIQVAGGLVVLLSQGDTGATGEASHQT